MPIFEFLCADCGKTDEILVTGVHDVPECKTCGSHNLQKLLSAHSSLSGVNRTSMPGPGDTACCGSDPVQAGCEGPGSCCENKSNY